MEDELERLGFRPLAKVSITQDRRSFQVDEFTEMASVILGVYAFIINNQVVRIGHTSRSFRERMKDYIRDVSWAFQNPDIERRNGTPNWEAEGWKNRLVKYGPGVVYAKQAHIVITDIGCLSLSESEERALIARYDPPLNSKREKDRARRWCLAAAFLSQHSETRQQVHLK